MSEQESVQEPYWLIAPNGEYYKNPKHLMNQANTPEAPVQPVQEPVKKCAQCKKEYTQGKARVGCPKCAPNVSVPESEFQKPITPPAAQRQWVGLTVAEMEELTLLVGRMDYTRMLQLAETKLKEKNT